MVVRVLKYELHATSSSVELRLIGICPLRTLDDFRPCFRRVPSRRGEATMAVDHAVPGALTQV
jgi:hypothetical protein